jgi:ABC-2 type transport system ATP-binding protein
MLDMSHRELEGSNGIVSVDPITARARPEPLVRVVGVGKVYEPSPLWLRFLLRSAISEPVIALDDINLEVMPGRICTVVGPNGAGKSTLFRILTGLTTPTTGSASILGLDATKESTNIRRVVGFMPSDERTLYLRHTCRENLRFHGRLQGMGLRETLERIDEMLEKVGLTHAADTAGFAMSAGMRARLQLARALFHHPKVVILDEPTGSIDPVGSYELMQLIDRLAGQDQLSVLLSSHRLEEIEALHDHVILLDRGKMIFNGDLDDVRRVAERPRIELTFDGPDQASAARTLFGSLSDIDTLSVDGVVVTLVTDIPAGQLLSTLDGGLTSVRSMTESRISLRELLARFYIQEPERRLPGSRVGGS